MVKVTLIEGTAAVLEENLATGKTDIAITLTPIHMENADIIEVGSEILYAVVPKSIMEKNFAGRLEQVIPEFQQGVSIKEFAHEPFIQYDPKEHLRQLMDKLFAENEIRPAIVAQTRSFHTALALAQNDLAIAVIPKYMLTSRLVFTDAVGIAKNETFFFPIKAQGEPEKLVIAYNNKRYLSSAARELINMVVTELSGSIRDTSGGAAE